MLLDHLSCDLLEEKRMHPNNGAMVYAPIKITTMLLILLSSLGGENNRKNHIFGHDVDASVVSQTLDHNTHGHLHWLQTSSKLQMSLPYVNTTSR